MITVTVSKEANFPVKSEKIKEIIKKTVSENGVVSDCDVSVALVHRKTMQGYVDKYYDDNEDHPVLSFPTNEIEGRFVFPPDGKLHLGEIVISYDWCVDEANKTGRLIEGIVLEMAEHGCLHLLGIHHA